MSRKSHYFKVGLFFFIAIALLIGCVLFIGLGGVFEEKYYVETYFTESVQGLEIGSEVRRRGVPIGKVDRIGFVSDYYRIRPNAGVDPQVGSAVYVRVSLSSYALGKMQEANENLQEHIQSLIDDGLRVQMKTLGITGVKYLEAEIEDKEKYPPMELAWTPENPYIPSIPSPLTQISNSVNEVFHRLQRLDIERIVANVNTFLETATAAIEDASIADLSTESQRLLASLRQSSDSLNSILASSDIQGIPLEASRTIASLRRSAERAEAPLAESLQTLQSVTAQLDKAITDARGEGGLVELFRKSLEHLDKGTESIPDVVFRLSETLNELNEMLASSSGDLDETITNMRVLTENLRDISEEAKSNPAGMIFSNPPPRKLE